MPVSLPSHILPSGPEGPHLNQAVSTTFAHAGNYACNPCRSTLNHANHQDAQSLSMRVDFSEPWKEGSEEEIECKNNTAEKISSSRRCRRRRVAER